MLIWSEANVLKAPVPVDGSQIAFCAIRHVIKLIKDFEPSSQLGYRRRLRVLLLRRGMLIDGARALHPLQRPPQTLGCASSHTTTVPLQAESSPGQKASMRKASPPVS